MNEYTTATEIWDEDQGWVRFCDHCNNKIYRREDRCPHCKKKIERVIKI